MPFSMTCVAVLCLHFFPLVPAQQDGEEEGGGGEGRGGEGKSAHGRCA
jgi:hypothetical protein